MKNLLRLLTLSAVVCCTAIQLNAQCVEWLDCPGASVPVCDSTSNDPRFWKGAALWDPLHETDDLCEAPFELQFKAFLPCHSSYALSWTLFLDLDGDGTGESVLSSDQTITAGYFPFDNLNNPGYSWMDSVQFDLRPVPPDQKFFFSTVDSLNGDSLEVALWWNTSTGSFTAAPQLPLGQHRVEWVLTQGNESDTCIVDFEISDCKAPTVVCINGLHANLLPTDELTLNASDFLQYAEDNATPADKIEIAIRKAGAGNGFPTDVAGVPLTSLTYDCTELGLNTVELWARDLSGNEEYCTSFIQINDDNGYCNTPPLDDTSVCVRSTCYEFPREGMEGVDVFFKVDAGGVPYYLPARKTGIDGCVVDFEEIIPPLSEVTMTFEYNRDHLNGVSTFDLILIGWHILNRQSIDNPYALIAADANHSGTITTADIIELRKLILGIYSQPSPKLSWRFLPATYVFPDPKNPFEPPFPEEIVVNNVNQLPQTMLGIKVGDVNCTLIANSVEAAAPRAAVSLSIPWRELHKEEILSLPLSLYESGKWEGAQLALQYDPATIEIMDVKSDVNRSAWDWYSPSPGELRIVWAEPEGKVSLPDESLFELVIRAKKEVKLSETLSLNEQSLQAEIYDQEGARPLELVFRNDVEEVQTLTPQPNPFTDQLRFPLRPEQGGQVFLRITDMQGRVVYEQSKLLSEGPQWLDVNTGSWPTGMYTWQVALGEQVYSGKVVKR
jgi:hypothetical protein